MKKILIVISLTLSMIMVVCHHFVSYTFSFFNEAYFFDVKVSTFTIDVVLYITLGLLFLTLALILIKDEYI